MAVRTNRAKWIETQGYWAIQVQRDGVRRRFTSSIEGRKGKAAAERKADEWLEAGAIKKTRFENVWNAYMEELRDTGSKSNFLQRESIGRTWLLPQLRTRTFQLITSQDWQKCINEAYKKGLSHKSLENIRGTITNLCRFARKSGIVKELPFDLTIPRQAPSKERHIMEADDIRKLFANDTVTRYGKQLPSIHVHAWRFLVLTGIRPGECCGLKWDDIEGDSFVVRRSINVHGEVTPGKNKNAQRREGLGSLALAELEKQRSLLRTICIVSPWVFPDQSGEHLTPLRLYEAWKKFRAEHGISPCSIYEMRHTMISYSKADVPEELLKKAVGHSKSMDTFGVYGHSVEGDTQRFADLVDGVFGRIIPGDD